MTTKHGRRKHKKKTDKSLGRKRRIRNDMKRGRQEHTKKKKEAPLSFSVCMCVQREAVERQGMEWPPKLRKKEK